MRFGIVDYWVFGIYLILVIGFGIWIANKERHHNSHEYFLAGKKLPWWAVGGSLIASNISAEQMIGMAGSGFLVGLAISSYEWMAAITLLVVAKFLIPVYLKENIQTMPQFLERRFDKSVRTGLAVFWVGLFVFVNIASLFFLGSLALKSILGISVTTAIIGLVLYSATFSIFGGLKAVVWTDVVQVIVLVVGGTFATVMVLDAVSEGAGIWSGLMALVEKAPEKFDMIFTTDVSYSDIATGEVKSAYALLPGLGVLIGGMWIANLYYWGFNQYIIQRALAAKDVREAQKGVVFAAFIKIFTPFIVVIPGIAAFVLGADLAKADEAYPWVINNYVSGGFKGLVVAAIVAAIGSSISSMVNSTSTIYTLDIHKPYFAKNASEDQLVLVGKITAGATLIIGALMAPALNSFDQIFQYIQKYTGFISPGVLAIFLFGLYWKKTTTKGALSAVFLAIPLSIFLDFVLPNMAFLHKMGLSFVILSAIIIVVSLIDGKSKSSAHAVDIPKGIFKTSSSFNIMALTVMMLIAAIYAMFW